MPSTVNLTGPVTAVFHLECGTAGILTFAGIAVAYLNTACGTTAIGCVIDTVFCVTGNIRIFFALFIHFLSTPYTKTAYSEEAFC